ncbi:MAG: glycosyltransferase [Butyrivibrio sp.]|nr:glycosyltransferase [Butyrivibrio sp.]
MIPEKCENIIAVLLSSYNGEKYIETQLDSIISQKVDAKVEIIVRDDGSTDGTVGILRRYEEENDNITVIEGSNIGFIKSFFTLIKEAPEADYYALSDQDDKWLPDKLQCAMTAIIKEEAAHPRLPILYGSSSFLVLGDMKPIRETQKMIRPMTLYNTVIQDILPGHSQVFNRELQRIIRDMPIEYDRIYVHDLFLTNIAMIRGKVIFDNCSHTLYRQYEEAVLGYGIGPVEWLRVRMKRLRKGDGQKIAGQMQYIVGLEQEHMKPKVRKELCRFLECRKNVLSRIGYIVRTKLYRQKRIESFLFRLAYIAGKYND